MVPSRPTGLGSPASLGRVLGWRDSHTHILHIEAGLPWTRAGWRSASTACPRGVLTVPRGPHVQRCVTRPWEPPGPGDLLVSVHGAQVCECPAQARRPPGAWLLPPVVSVCGEGAPGPATSGSKKMPNAQNTKSEAFQPSALGLCWLLSPSHSLRPGHRTGQTHPRPARNPAHWALRKHGVRGTGCRPGLRSGRGRASRRSEGH